MALVDYDSDESELEDNPVPAAKPPQKSSLFAALPPPKNRQAGGRKRIVVDLGRKGTDPTLPDAQETPDKSLKRKAESGRQGLSSMLPAPKRSFPKTEAAVSETKRNPEPTQDRSNGESIMNKSDDQVTLSGNSLTFKPKSIKKTPAGSAKQATVKPKKLSLFSVPTESQRSRIQSSYTEEQGQYQPILATESRPVFEPVPQVQVPNAAEEPGPSDQLHPSEQFRYNPNADYSTFGLDPDGDQVETKPASRKRHGQDEEIPSSARVQEFNVNAEYETNHSFNETSNEHTAAPVRFVGAGKHQLSSLLNLAHSQRDALEETFTSQRRAMKDAKAKYGR